VLLLLRLLLQLLDGAEGLPEGRDKAHQLLLQALEHAPLNLRGRCGWRRCLLCLLHVLLTLPLGLAWLLLLVHGGPGVWQAADSIRVGELPRPGGG